MQSWEPFSKSKAGFCYFFFLFFLCRYIQRLEYVKLSSTKDHHTILPMNVASIKSRTWSTVMFTSTPLKKVLFILNKALMLHSNITPSTML